MYFHIDPKKNVPLYEQIIQQVKEMVAKGILQPGEKLPSVRELSSRIVINPNTVSKAYQELERQEVIVTIRGRGTFINEDVIQAKDPKKTEAIRQTLKQTVIDSHYAGIDKKTIMEWVEEFDRELRGDRE
ncbi:GntR family transcriptional regulator [Alteribacter natronophilus]|uniref:GntR family transcriptional regulator n=1 Tax=Alteribacter natronophilus TaxID=2583810 RepID=UPI00110E11ED|nr:GntR family transcriptional regulator [Alteribacter natronophilus]TMW70280.1 GntR family transcriptional regulator [Alteribacter natronophilus]